MFGWLGARSKRAAFAVGAAVLAATGAVACTGDEVFGPVDAVPCTRGVLDVSTVTESAITSRDCSRWSDRLGSETYAESWTLKMRPRTGYVFRLVPVESTPGVFPFSGALRVYERNAHGDTQLATESLAYGVRNQEVIMTTDAAREIALRVEADSPADTGRYRIEVSTCPVRRLPLDTLIERVSTVEGCLSQGNFMGPNSRLTFLDFAVDGLDDVFVGFERSSGTGALRGGLHGVDLDFSDLFATSVSMRAPTAGVEYSFELNPRTVGRYTLTVRIHADSSATFGALATTVPALHAGSQP